ncbi:MAG: MFS transporter [Eggerthellaceae bacterium]|nr:MFS transporter [Eggerthellaceae bacterium]
MAEITVDKSAYGTTKVAQWGVADDQLNMGKKWLSFIVLFAFAIGCVFQYMMVTPILPQICDSFGVDIAESGMLMSLFSIIGIIVAYPATWIMQNVGVKMAVVVTAVVSALGTVLCLFASSWEMLLAGRALQGCAFGLIAVIGPNIIPRLFPVAKQGLAMGIYSMWFPVGQVIATFVVPVIYLASGWVAPFWMSLGILVVTTALFFALFKLPAVPENLLASAKEATEKGKARVNYFKSALIVGFSFIGFEIAFYCYNNFFATYAQMVQGMDVAMASQTVFVANLLTIPVGVIAGILCDKTQRRKEMLIAAYVVYAIAFAGFVWLNEGNQTIAWIASIVLGVIPFSFIPVCTRCLVPVLAPDPKKCDWALTGMAVGTTVGGFGAGFFMNIVGATSWHTAGLIVAIVPIVTAIILFFVKKDHGLTSEE